MPFRFAQRHQFNPCLPSLIGNLTETMILSRCFCHSQVRVYTHHYSHNIKGLQINPPAAGRTQPIVELCQLNRHLWFSPHLPLVYSTYNTTRLEWQGYLSLYLQKVTCPMLLRTFSNTKFWDVFEKWRGILQWIWSKLVTKKRTDCSVLR